MSAQLKPLDVAPPGLFIGMHNGRWTAFSGRQPIFTFADDNRARTFAKENRIRAIPAALLKGETK